MVTDTAMPTDIDTIVIVNIAVATATAISIVTDINTITVMVGSIVMMVGTIVDMTDVIADTIVGTEEISNVVESIDKRVHPGCCAGSGSVGVLG
jgi:hypothetical protein